MRFSGSIQPRVRIVPGPVSGRLTRSAVRFAFGVLNEALRETVGVPLIRTGCVSTFVWYSSRESSLAAFISALAVTPASSVSVSALPLPGPKVSAPRAGAPAVSRSTASPVAGSGHSGYGVGLALPHTRLTVAPSTTRWPAVVATADARVSVLPAMLVITRVVLVIVPSALVCGTVRVKPIRNGLVSATASVAVLDCSPVTAD